MRQHRLYRRFDSHLGRIEKQRIRRGFQRRHRAGGVARIARPHVGNKGWEISRVPLSDQLLIPPLGTCLGTGCQEHFGRGVSEHHGAHVAAIGHQSRGLLIGALTVEQGRAHSWQRGHFRGPLAHGFRPDRLGDIVIRQPYRAIVERGRQFCRQFSHARFIIQCHTVLHGRQRGQAIECAAVEKMEPQRNGHPLGHGALARC